MLTEAKAKQFAADWIQSWNSHDLSSILSHYANDVEFYSPFIPLLKFNDSGLITSKSHLEKYFKIGLDAYPELHFKLHNVFTGIDTVTIYYTSVNGRMAAEVFRLDASGKAKTVFCNYSNQPSSY